MKSFAGSIAVFQGWLQRREHNLMIPWFAVRSEASLSPGDRKVIFLPASLIVLLLGVLALQPTFHDLKILSAVFSASAIALMFVAGIRNGTLPEKSLPLLATLLVVDGTLIRLVLAWFFQGNYDAVSWQIAAERYHLGLDPYSGNARYNSPPIWFWILGALKSAQNYFPKTSFHFVFCSFLTLIDLATFFVLAKIAKRQNVPAYIPALFFYFNPVSFLLTGYQGQFDSIPILCVVLGLWFFLSRRSGEGAVLFWICCTLGTVIKQIIFFETLVALNAGFKRVGIRLLLFGLTSSVFVALLMLYWAVGKEDILRNVIFYSSYALPYGISTFFKTGFIKWGFISALVLFPFTIRKYSVERQLLMMMLFFLVFTTGVGVQYFVLPVALGALVPSLGSRLYAASTTLFLLGNYYNLHIQALSFMPWNAVWISAALWFLLELRHGPSDGAPTDVALK